MKNKLKASYYLLAFLTLMGSGMASAQNPLDNIQQDFAHPSPDAQSISIFNDYPVSASNGTVDISIPLLTVQQDNISIPLTLRYNTSGIKVNQEASWVGLGWSLNGSGMISREMRGLPDEHTYGFKNKGYLATSTIDLTQQAGSDYLKGLVDGTTDGQADVFNYSFPGYSGKFVFHNDGSIITIPYTPLQIETTASLDYFEITTPNGDKYKFDMKEVTRNHGGGGSDFTSAWLLTKIDPYNSTSDITFTYEDDQVDADYYLSYHTNTLRTNCTEQDNFDAISTVINRRKIDTKRLSKIETDLQRVEFIESSTFRSDITGSKELKEIKVYNKHNNTLTRSVLFSYGYFESTQATTDPYELRLKLESVSLNGPAEEYSFTYNTSINLPSKKSNAIDHWGYYNGATGNTHTIPNPFNETSTKVFSGADRKATSSCLANMLSTITYPTGGFVEFEFEPHQALIRKESMLVDWLNNMSESTTTTGNSAQWPHNQTPLDIINSVIYPSGPAPDPTWPTENNEMRYFTVGDLKYTSKVNTTHSTPGGLACNTNCGIVIIGEKDNPSNIIYSKTFNSDVSVEDPITFTANTEYYMYVRTYEDAGISNSTTVSWYEDKGLTSMMLGGARILRKKYYESSSSNPVNVTRYEYDLGVMYNLPRYDYEHEYITQDVNGNDIGCKDRILSSNNMAELYQNGSHIGYKVRTDFSGENGELGKVITTMDDGYFLPETPDYPYSPITNQDWARGKVLKQEVFKYNNTSSSFVKVKESEYDYTSTIFNSCINYIAAAYSDAYGTKIWASSSTMFDEQGTIKDFDTDGDIDPTGGEACYGCVARVNGTSWANLVRYRKYLVESGAIYLKKETNKEFDDAGILTLSTVTSHTYDNSLVLGPTESKAVLSDGSVRLTTHKYSNQYEGTVLSSFFTNNEKGLGTVIETQNWYKVDDQSTTKYLLSSVVNEFDNNGRLFKQHTLHLDEKTSNVSEPVGGSSKYSTLFPIVNGGSSVFEPQFTLWYNNHGHVQEIEDKVGRRSSVYYSYDGHLPALVATNASFQSLDQEVTNLQSNFNNFYKGLDVTNGTDRTSWATFNTDIRNALPGALLSSKTYGLNFSTTSTCTANNVTNYYQFDDRFRLVEERDQFYDILKTIEFGFTN